MAIRFGEILRDHGRFNDFFSISSMLLSPTIYDPQYDCDNFQITPALAKKARVTLDRDLRNPKIVLYQMEILYKCINALIGMDPASDIIELMEGEQPGRILTSSIHRLYFNSLLQNRNYDKLFIIGTQMVTLVEGYPFALTVNSQMEQIAFPRLNRFLQTNCVIDPQDPMNPEQLISGALTIINITQNCTFLPNCLERSLPNFLTRFGNELKSFFSRTSSEKALLYANDTLDTLHRIREAKRTNVTFCTDQLNEFITILKRYTITNSK
jgi:hypothetical protein